MDTRTTEAPPEPTTRQDDRIADLVHSALVASGVELTEEPTSSLQLRDQVRGILADVSVALGITPADAVVGRPQGLSVVIGRSRARGAVHPSTSLEAASRVFEIALPLLVADLHDRIDDPDPATAVGRALHRAIMARVAPAAVSYVETLLEKLTIAQQEERRRISRELHDHVAHDVAAAIQRVVLTRSAVTGADGSAAEYLDVAERLLRSALADTRSIGVELRQVVGDRTLDEAVAEYVAANPVLRTLVDVHATGHPVALPAAAGEELYVMVRESLRNAVAHAHASAVSVHVAWGSGSIRVVVVDDGRGFRIDQRPTASMGLLAMRERAEAIGAELTITSRVGEGTTIVIEIDHGGDPS